MDLVKKFWKRTLIVFQDDSVLEFYPWGTYALYYSEKTKKLVVSILSLNKAIMFNILDGERLNPVGTVLTHHYEVWD